MGHRNLETRSSKQSWGTPGYFDSIIGRLKLDLHDGGGVPARTLALKSRSARDTRFRVYYADLISEVRSRIYRKQWIRTSGSVRNHRKQSQDPSMASCLLACPIVVMRVVPSQSWVSFGHLVSCHDTFPWWVPSWALAI